MTLNAQDRLSFESFFECTFPAMLARAIMLCGHRQTAEDAVAEAYAEALRRWDRIGGYDLPEAWVYKVMSQRLWKESRRQARLGAVAGDIPVSAAAAGPEQAAEVREVLRRLAGLPRLQRAAIVLHCLQGLSQDEVARELGVKRGTVAASIFQARRTLAESLGLPRAARRVSREDFVAASVRTAQSSAMRADDPVAAMLEVAEDSIRAAVAAEPAGAGVMLARIRANAGVGTDDRVGDGLRARPPGVARWGGR
jgi:RNA polymerase sigma factor (sigma-70 family)